METRQCPKCFKDVEIPEKKFGQSEPPCPLCGADVLWFIQDDKPFIGFKVVGGTGAMRQGRKKWGGRK